MRTKEPAGRGVAPPHHAAGLGLSPQRLGRFLPPHGREVPAPRVREAATAAVRAGGTRIEHLGVPPLQGLAHSGPLGPELGAAGALDGGEPDQPVLGPVPAVPPSVPGSRQEVLEAQDPGEQPHEGGQGPRYSGGGGGVGNTRAAWRYHQRTRARPWCCRWCSVRGPAGPGPRARVLAPGLVPVHVLLVHAPCAKKAGCRSRVGLEPSRPPPSSLPD